MDWSQVYDILIREAGAREWMRDSFLAHADTFREFRFQGLLGFGGKIWKDHEGHLTVDCYSEDLTPERRAIIERTNAALAMLKN